MTDPSRAQLLTLANLDEIVDLYSRTLAALGDPSHLYPRGRETFRRLIGPDGFLIGIPDDGRIVAFTALRVRRHHPAHVDIIRRHAGHPLGRHAHSDGVVVDPDYRSRSYYHTLMARREDIARCRGVKSISAVVAKTNRLALRGYLKRNFAIIAGYEDADGDNYFLLKSMNGPAQQHVRGGLRHDLSSTASHFACLKRGMVGRKAPGNAEPMILFSQPDFSQSDGRQSDGRRRRR